MNMNLELQKRVNDARDARGSRRNPASTQVALNKREQAEHDDRLQVAVSFAEQKLSLSMPKNARYPEAWHDKMSTMPSKDVAQLVGVLSCPEVSPDSWTAAANKFLNHIRRDNRAAAKEAKRHRKWALLEVNQNQRGVVAAAQALTEAEHREAEVLQRRRAQHLQHLENMCEVLGRRVEWK